MAEVNAKHIGLTLDTSGTFRCFLTPTRGPWGAAGPGAASPAPARGRAHARFRPIQFGYPFPLAQNGCIECMEHKLLAL